MLLVPGIGVAPEIMTPARAPGETVDDPQSIPDIRGADIRDQKACRRHPAAGMCQPRINAAA
jgi:hypothetical protein